MPRDTRRRQPDPDSLLGADDPSKNHEDKFNQHANHCPDKPGRPCTKGDHRLQYQEFLSLLASHNILGPSKLQDVLAGKIAYYKALREKLSSTFEILEKSRHFGFLGSSTATKQPKYRDTPDEDGREMYKIRKQRAERRSRNEQQSGGS